MATAQRRHGRAFTSDLSAQDFFRLLAAGAVPVSFVLGTCVYHVAHQTVMQSLRQAYQNQEMMQFTGTAVRRLTHEHRLPETSPMPTFTLGLDN